MMCLHVCFALLCRRVAGIDLQFQSRDMKSFGSARLAQIQIQETIASHPAALATFESGMLDFLSDDDAL